MAVEIKAKAVYQAIKDGNFLGNETAFTAEEIRPFMPFFLSIAFSFPSNSTSLVSFLFFITLRFIIK